MTVGTLIFIGLLVVAAVFAVSIYNGLVAARQAYRNAFSQIDVQLTRRHDLIPNLVETVKRYLSHERDTLEAVIQARAQAISGLNAAKLAPGDATALGQLGQAENGLSQALGRLLAVAEAYPDLKANQNMMQLNEELTSTENRVAFARQAFNDSVMSYNTKREVFPNNLMAGTFGFTGAAYLQLDDPVKLEVPKVQF